MKGKANERKYLFALGIALLLVTMFTFFLFINMQAKTIEEGKVVQTVSSLYPEYSIEDLVKDSDIIAVGQLMAQSDVLEIEPVNGGDIGLFTDYVVQLQEVLKDEGNQAKETVNLRLRGGENDEKIVIDSEVPQVSIGDQHLFFLVYPKTGGGYTTKGDYVLLTGGSQGLFNLTEKNEFIDLDLNKTIDKNSLLKMVHDPSLKKSKAESDPYYGLKQNLKTGFITQEEYDEAIKQLNQYAKIVNKN